MQTWLPLESNPEIWNRFSKELGLGDGWSFVDIWSIEPEMLQMVPRPVKAVVLLFPITENYEAFRLKESETLTKEYPKDLLFMNQTIENACGTIALLHSLLNNSEIVTENSFISTLKGRIANLNSMQIAQVVEKQDFLEEIHRKSSEEGETEIPDQVDLHFVCFVECNGHLFELDGRKVAPVDHGPLVQDDLVEAAAKAIAKFIERDPENVNVSILGLSMD